jgi:hypothetical protein
MTTNPTTPPAGPAGRRSRKTHQRVPAKLTAIPARLDSTKAAIGWRVSDASPNTDVKASTL